MNDNFDPNAEPQKKKGIVAQAKEDVLSNFDKVLKLNSLQKMVLIILIFFVIISVHDLTKPLHPAVVDKDEAVQGESVAVPAL